MNEEDQAEDTAAIEERMQGIEHELAKMQAAISQAHIEHRQAFARTTRKERRAGKRQRRRRLKR